jgi:putative alpha-1,2-mannosidase
MAIYFCTTRYSGMIEAYGKDKFEKKLDQMFHQRTSWCYRINGQYAHGNEPSHHMAYLYNYIENQKSYWKVHYILDNFYKTHPMDW